MKRNNEIRIGVIGAGGRGWLSGHAHKPELGSRMVAAADVSESVLASYRKTYEGVFTSKRWQDVLDRKDVDAVFVSTPDFLHEPMAVAALEAGKAVYLEKPMAITIEGCDRILETAYRTKRKLYVGHNMRHMSFVLKLKELIDQGAIGDVKAIWCRHFICYGGDAYFKDWHAEKKYSTSLLLQKGTHDLDVMHWLGNGLATRVSGMGGLVVHDRLGKKRKVAEPGRADWSVKNWPPRNQTGLNPYMDVEDLSMVQMQYDNGVFASYQQCHFTPDAYRNYTVIGTEGRIENIDESPGVVRLWNKRTHYNPHGDQQFFIHPEEGTHGGADPKIVAEFLQFLRGEVKASTCPIASRYSVAAGCQAARSIRQGGKPMDIPPLKKHLVDYFKKQCKEGPFPVSTRK